MSVHEIAAAGFDKEATTYAQSRPSYPTDAVDWITAHLRLAPGIRCVDLAAGTGIFTRLINASGCDLVAIEPVEGMRTELRSSLPAMPTLSAIAESLPLRNMSIDAVTIAQAFHWFDADAALAELRRVLKVGGRVALLWNARDRSRDWVDQVWGVMDRVEKHAPWRNHDQVATDDSQATRESELNGAEGFGPTHTAQFHHEQIVTPQQVVLRVKGVSHVAVLPAREQQIVLDEVRSIVTTHPDTAGRSQLAIPYRVDCYWLERTV